MRIVVLLIGFIGVAMTASLGVALVSFEETLTMVKTNADLDLGFLKDSLTGSQHNDTSLVLFLTAGYGAFGAILAFLRCGRQGALLLLVPVLFCAIMNPYTLAFTWMQALAGLLSMLISPLPLSVPVSEGSDD